MRKVLILGGGFGGVYTAKKLRKIKSKNFDIELISNDNYFVFQPLLPEVASGKISSSDAVTPLREILKNIRYRNAEIEKIDLKKKKVIVLQGFRKRQHALGFDHLVIAIGQESNLEIVPGLKDHAFSMRNLKDAYSLRNHILGCLELADVTKDLKLKERLLSFVVVGGGFSGVETVGEIKDMVDKALPYYSNISSDETMFHIIEAAENILPELGSEVSTYTEKVFKADGIKLYLKSSLKHVSASKVFINNNDSISTNTVISTIGSTVSKLIKNSTLPLKNGKIITNSSLQVKGYENIWAVGDSALIPNKFSKDKKSYASSTAQFAVREANLLAKNINLHERGKELKEFKYKSKGSLASLGSRRGIGKISIFTVKGLFAWLIWRTFYLSFIPSFATKSRVLLGWIIEFFIPRNAIMTEPFRGNPIKYETYKKGEIVFEEGMIADGFYIVKEGSFENNYKKTKSGKVFSKKYFKGSHFGSRVILSGDRRTGKIVALTDSRVLKISSKSFKLLTENFSVLSEYFSEYLPRTFKNLELKEEEKNRNVKKNN